MIFKAAKLFKFDGGKLLKAKFKPTIPIAPRLATTLRSDVRSSFKKLNNFNATADAIKITKTKAT